jgi:uncharacterized membrane protein
VNQELFYATSSALCFTLLGFWWVVVQFRHADLTRTRAARSFSLLVSLQFLLPGFISLASLAAGEGSPLWRAVFATAGIAGLLSGLVALRARSRERALGVVGGLAWLTTPVYAVLTVIAMVPDAVRAAGFVPIQVEAFVLTALLLIGVLIAWFLFVEPVPSEPA